MEPALFGLHIHTRIKTIRLNVMSPKHFLMIPAALCKTTVSTSELTSPVDSSSHSPILFTCSCSFTTCFNASKTVISSEHTRSDFPGWTILSPKCFCNLSFNLHVHVVQDSLVLELTSADIATNRSFRTERVVIEVVLDRTVSSIFLHKLLKAHALSDLSILALVLAALILERCNANSKSDDILHPLQTSQYMTAFAFESHSRFCKWLHQALFAV